MKSKKCYIVVSLDHKGNKRYWTDSRDEWSSRQKDAQRFTLRWGWYALHEADTACAYQAAIRKVVPRRPRYVIKYMLGGTTFYLGKTGAGDRKSVV